MTVFVLIAKGYDHESEAVVLRVYDNRDDAERDANMIEQTDPDKHPKIVEAFYQRVI